jgi:SAM-dependent methyltransferase
VRPYTAERIAHSYANIERLLSTCQSVGTRCAVDIGCGSGFDSFALGAHFDRVGAVDADPKAIGEARRIACLAGVSNIEFECVAADEYLERGGPPADFVLCNVMSHHLGSRCHLARAVAPWLRGGGWLVYAEESEGYGPMEVHRAIARRDRIQLAHRVQQVLNGFTGTPEFRFFVSGTMQALVESIGFAVVGREVGRWNGLVTMERLFCQKTSEASSGSARPVDADYLTLAPEFADTRRHFATWLAERPRAGLTPAQRKAIWTQATAAANVFSPFLVFLLMADVARLRPSAVPASSLTARRVCAALRARVGWGFRAPTWTTLSGFDRPFIGLARQAAGLGSDAIDD